MNKNFLRASDEELLENISKTLSVDPHASQRTIAENCNISLGMANAVLKRFIERGWIMVKNLNSCKLVYALSDEGLKTLTARGKKYIKTTFSLINDCSENILTRIAQAKEEGKKSVSLCGNSYIKFLIEYSCKTVGLEFNTFDIGQDIDSENSLKLVGELSDKNVIEQYEEKGFINVMNLVEVDRCLFT